MAVSAARIRRGALPARASRSSSGSPTSTRARRARSPTRCAPPTTTTSTAGTTAARRGTTGSSARRRRAAAFARLVNGAARRRRRHDLALGRRERARERVDFARAAAGRDHATSSSRRSARSGTRRSCAAPRSCTSRPTATRSRSSASRRRSTSARRVVSITAVCYRNGARLPVEEIAAHRARARRARACSTPTRRSARIRSTSTRSASTSSAAGVLKYLLASAGLGFLWMPARASPSGCCRRRPAGSPTATSSRWTSHDYSPSPTARRFQSGTPPIPAIYAGIAGIELMQEIGIAETREHVNALNERLIAGVDELGGDRRHAARARAARRARLHPLDRRARARRRARGGRDRHLRARRQPPRLAPRLQHRRRHRRGLAALARGTGTSCAARW